MFVFLQSQIYDILKHITILERHLFGREYKLLTVCGPVRALLFLFPGCLLNVFCNEKALVPHQVTNLIKTLICVSLIFLWFDFENGLSFNNRCHQWRITKNSNTMHLGPGNQGGGKFIIKIASYPVNLLPPQHGEHLILKRQNFSYFFRLGHF